MKEICNNKLCTGCGVCSLECPAKCIEMTVNDQGFNYPVINNAKCINCKRCEKVCPINMDVESYYPISVYASWSKDDSTRKFSSSGGVFWELADLILNKKGYVSGAVLDMPDVNLYHCVSDDIDDVRKMCGSKYFQSNCIDSYIKVKSLLEQNKIILYTGTACQIAALNNFLKNTDKRNLYTVDVLCHGVSSKKVVKKYLESLENKYKSKVSAIEFRNKDQNYGGVCTKVTFENGYIYYGKSNEDIYIKLYNMNITLRKSCYNCKFANEKRIADLTIADFWGLGEVESFPEKTNGGTSIILVNTSKGDVLIKNIRDKCNLYPRTYQEAKRRNQCLTKPMGFNRKRGGFFAKLDTLDFEKLANRLLYFEYKGMYLKEISFKIKRKIKSLIK